MRVSGITSTNAYRKSPSFGKIKDSNAKRVLKECGIRRFANGRHKNLTRADIRSYRLIKKCNYVDVYTDKTDGRVKAKIDPELKDYIREGDFQDMAQFCAMQRLASVIEDIEYDFKGYELFNRTELPPWDEDRIITSQYYV